MELQFEEAKNLIRARRFEEAREILETIDHPKARNWILKIDEMAPRTPEPEIRDTDELLNEASGLIRAKRFDEARDILETLDHPKATKWLQKLDEIAPRQEAKTGANFESVIRSIDEKFNEASTLIRAKRLREARQILETIDDPKAKKWLQRIDNMEPYTSSDEDGDESASYSGASEKQKSKLRWGEPWNPSLPPGMGGVLGAAIFFTPFLLLPIMNVFLSVNWRRLGKPFWMQMSLAGSLTAGVGFWVILPLMASLRMSSSSIITIMMFLVGVSYWLNLTMTHLQKDAYKAWIRQGSPEALYNHEYHVATWASLYGVGVVIFAMCLMVYFNTKDQPKTYDDTALTFQYPSDWYTLDIKGLGNCVNPPNGGRCLMALQQGGETGLIIFEGDIPGGWALKDVDLRLWENVGPLQASLKNKSETVLDGQPAILREYSFKDPTHTSNTDAYAIMIAIVNGNKYYQMFFFSTSQPIFEEDRKAIQGIYPTLDFK